MSTVFDRADQTSSIDSSRPKSEVDDLSKEAPLSLRLYRVVWRWHFYAGLFVIPFLLMLAITGIIYLFKPQLDAWMYRDLMYVQPAGELLPYTQQMETVLAAYPQASLSSLMPVEAANRSSEFTITTADGRTLTVFVNPYSGEVLGERNEENNLQYYALTLHGELMVGTWGDRLIELAASWALVLIVSGLYLWWPRERSWGWGALLPRLGSTNRRVWWRDLHAVTGIWGAGILAFMLITGLPWTGFWGTQFARLFPYPAQMWDEVPVSTKLTGSLNTEGEKIVPWAAEQMPMPQSNAGEHANHQSNTTSAHNSPPSEAQPVSQLVVERPVTLDTVAAFAVTQNAPAGYSISLPEDETGVFTLSAFPDDPRQGMTLHIDQYIGQDLAAARWAEYGWGPKVVEMGISLHEGRFFGFWNQMLMLLACLMVIVLCTSATVMWWQRRPAGRLGAPAMPRNLPLWKGAVAIIVVMGILFPLMGISLLVVLALDYLLIARIPRLQRVFS